jgi:hypothetical protein
VAATIEHHLIEFTDENGGDPEMRLRKRRQQKNR